MSSLLVWSFIEFKSAKNNYALADEIAVNFFERATLRDQYFLYREDRTRIQWDKNKEVSDQLLSQANIRFKIAENRQTLARLQKYIDDTAAIFHRIVDNTERLNTVVADRRHVYEELDRRLYSQLLLKAALVRDTATALRDASSRRVELTYQRLIIVTGLFALTIALITILTSISLGRLIRRRLIPLHDGAKIIAQGNLDHRIKAGGADEFVELAQSINAMTDKLQAFTRKLEAEIGERKHAEAALQKSNELLQTVIENVPARIFWKDWTLHYIGCNTHFAQDAGYSRPDMIIGKTDFDMGWKAQAELYRSDDKATMDSGTSKLDYEEPQTTPDGNMIWLRTSKVPLRDENNLVIGVLGIYQDITKQRTVEEQIRHLAHFDPLTDLPNRTLFSDRLQQALATARRDKSHLALMFVDLDKFKQVNDRLGHYIGDLLLKEVAKRMQGCVRESDTVARIGGDEFVVLLPSIETAQDAAVVAEKIREAIDRDFVLSGEELLMSVSIGVAVYPEHGKDEHQLAKNADIAMYHAKKGGRNNVMIFQTEMAVKQD
ncbi:MAG: hypothetical protein A2061_05430 [Gallionellales bacterium GWA2_59_43]|nr:MAG: hypothetical protein A2061_05430 [Gallionellales bacterium GWA2_59_43]